VRVAVETGGTVPVLVRVALGCGPVGVLVAVLVAPGGVLVGVLVLVGVEVLTGGEVGVEVAQEPEGSPSMVTVYPEHPAPAVTSWIFT
jgi:hypothetical protein